MQHIQFCIEEILAEIDAAHGESAAAKALRQLDEREARGEALVAVDGSALRARLQQQLEPDPYAEVRTKLMEIKALLATTASGAPAVAPVAAPAPMPAPVAAAETMVAEQRVAAETVKAPSRTTDADGGRRPALATVTRLDTRRAKSMAQRIAEATSAAAAIAFLVVFTSLAPAPEVVARTNPLGGLIGPMAELLSLAPQD